MSFTITDKSIPAKPDYSLDPELLEFGKKFAANMFVCEYKNGKWGEGQLKPLEDFKLHPAAIVFHYGQALFEGMKAFKGPDGQALLFRPMENARRLNKSAERLAFPTFPEDFFLEAVKKVVSSNYSFIPGKPGNLYIRPAMIGVEPCIGVRSSVENLFFIIALPTGSYFKNTAVNDVGTVPVLISEDVARAARGGLGGVKAAANYAVTLKTIAEAKDQGYSQVLFLDAEKREFLEEMGGMNIFFYDGEKIFTPKLSDTILEGITRKSIIEIAPRLGIKVEERKIPLVEILEGIEKGEITESFACGTAAVLTGISSFKLSNKGNIYNLKNPAGPITKKIYSALTAIQRGETEDPFNWVIKV
jgi:branched-chain amino acid aminotransferase